MKRKLSLATIAVWLPLTAFAMPEIGDLVGTNPEDAKTALAAAGCDVQEFDAEDGQVEAKCIDTETKMAMEVYIDPDSGVVTKIKEQD